ncbi:MAG: 6-phosphogluconolactonase [Arenicella sp.]|jgi:6-phosphogluconolactonase
MNSNYTLHQGADAQSLAEHLAGEVAQQIFKAINEKGSAVLALSGGSTPKPLFEALVEHDIDWAKVIITLVDERWVDQDHVLSNAAFMKTYLLDKLPDSVRFVPLYQKAETVEASLPFVISDYLQITNSTVDAPRSFDIVILGMGSDGHTASFFPDAENIDELVDIDSNEALLSCKSPSSQVERVTWSLPVLLNTNFLALHFTGYDKRVVFEVASENGDSRMLPIRSVLFQDRVGLNVYYAD